MAATPVFSAFAADVDITGSPTKDVTVGEVDETIYSVDINWGDMAFDWKYNEEMSEFNFKAHKTCQEYVYYGSLKDDLDIAKEYDMLFTNNTCSMLVTEDLVEHNSYYVSLDTPASRIDVIDSSINGKIKASASFVAETNYQWVTGKFGMYSKPEGVTAPFLPATVFTEFEDGVFPLFACGATATTSSCGYSGYLKLEKNSSISNTTPITTNDKIGTVIINIEPDLN